jgi:hypothetical protein
MTPSRLLPRGSSQSPCWQAAILSVSGRALRVRVADKRFPGRKYYIPGFSGPCCGAPSRKLMLGSKYQLEKHRSAS